MIILTIKTDQPLAEVGLYNSDKKLADTTWEGHLKLSETIHSKIDELLKSQNFLWSNIGGIILYKGPGSFTGLRIGASVANTLASDLNIPISGSSGEVWVESGLNLLKAAPSQRIVLPEYGSEVKITTPRK